MRRSTQVVGLVALLLGATTARVGSATAGGGKWARFGARVLLSGSYSLPPETDPCRLDCIHAYELCRRGHDKCATETMHCYADCPPRAGSPSLAHRESGAVARGAETAGALAALPYTIIGFPVAPTAEGPLGPERAEGPPVAHEVYFLENGTPKPEAATTVGQWVDEAFARHHVRSAAANHHFRIILEDRFDPLSSKMSGLVSGLTLSLVPAHTRDRLVLTIEVVRNDETLRSFQYRDHVDTWIQVGKLFFGRGPSPETVTHEVVDTMLTRFLHDLDG